MPAAHLPPSGLLGRRGECAALDQLVAGVRAGQSRVLVLHGEAGVGKTALLEYLVDAATNAHSRVARAAGVESEMELPFAGLHALCAPMLDHLDRLPAPQRDALATAFGLHAGDPPDRFLVGLAVLTLLADVAEAQPLICVVDDAQWLDGISAQTLAFVARRLLAERVGLVFAVREPVDGAGGFGVLPGRAVGGIGDEAARSLLEATLPGRLDDRVRDRILGEADGNPLALLELPRGLRPADVAGGYGLPGAMPLASRIEQGFARQLEPLPRDARRLLLLAAAEPVGDVTLLWRAAELLGIEPDAAAAALGAGWLDVGVRVRFRHPLVRSAAYRAATAVERRAVHAALAEATDQEQDPDRHAWHRANAADGLDEAVADELEHSAGRARARGGVAAAAAFLERAAELTPDAARRGRLALAAAQAKFQAAAPEAALELLAVAEMSPLDALQRARLALLRGEIAFALRRGRDAPPLLLAAARDLEALDPLLARETYLQAIGAAMYVGRLSNDDGGVRAVAAAARAAAPAVQPPRSVDLVLDGLVTRFTEGSQAGVAALRVAQEAFLDEPLETDDDVLRWLLLCPIVISQAVFELMDDAAFDTLASRAVVLARQTGALTMLQVALPYRAGVLMFAGEFDAASALIEEANTITAASGNAGLVYAWLLLGAWRGDEAQAQRLIDLGVGDATDRGEGRVLALAGYASSILNNGLGRYEAAIEGALRGCEDDDQGYAGPALGELVEAAMRGGRPDLAGPALARLEVRARASGTDWALGLLTRSQALAADGDEADALYRAALTHFDRTRIRVQLARTYLVYGEWLRRERRRADARAQLRAAHDLFVRFGADAFAERARRELLATGETVRRTSTTRDALTPQEVQIARLAADGNTNPEIGAQLFISPRTVEYHLRKVFTKLDVSSRKDLHAALAPSAAT